MTTQQLPLAHPGKPTILVIEDNADQWFIIHWALRQRFPEVEPFWVADPSQALQYLETCLEHSLDLPRLIVLDLYLPSEAIGLKTLQLLKKSAKLYRQIPVVVLSQFGDSDSLHACYQEGANAYLTKPLTPVEWLDWFALFRTYWWCQVKLPDLTLGSVHLPSQAPSG